MCSCYSGVLNRAVALHPHRGVTSSYTLRGNKKLGFKWPEIRFSVMLISERGVLLHPNGDSGVFLFCPLGCMRK